MTAFEARFTAGAEDIDELGHVNNAVWVRWTQELAVAHWQAVAPPDHQAAYIWVVTRHVIDYRGNIGPGDGVTGMTRVEGMPKGARFDRRTLFTGDDGRVKVEATTTWALIERASGRLMRVPAAVAAPFLGDG